MKKLLLGLLISVTLLSTMVGCASSKEVNGKQIEVVMEKKEYDMDDCDAITDYLNEQRSKEADYYYLTMQVVSDNNKDLKNTFMIRVEVRNLEYGHDKETIDYVNQFKFIPQELEAAFKGTEIRLQVVDNKGNKIAHYDNKTEKMVLDIE